METFQPQKNVIIWKLHFSSSPQEVYKALSTDEGRAGYWAESAIETNGEIQYVFLNGIEDKGKILEKVPDKKFVVTYFGWKVTFNLSKDGNSGTDLEMRAEGIVEEERIESIAGWVS